VFSARYELKLFKYNSEEFLFSDCQLQGSFKYKLIFCYDFFLFFFFSLKLGALGGAVG
jgi:hypothetical protein